MNNFNRNSKNRGRRDFSKRGSFGGDRDRDRERTQMHETTCSACGKRCEVPFRPTGQKPVYCNECFRKNNERRGDSFEKTSRERDSFQGKREDSLGKEEFNKLIDRLDTIINILTAKEKTEKNGKEIKKSITKKTMKKPLRKK